MRRVAARAAATTFWTSRRFAVSRRPDRPRVCSDSVLYDSNVACRRSALPDCSRGRRGRCLSSVLLFERVAVGWNAGETRLSAPRPPDVGRAVHSRANRRSHNPATGRSQSAAAWSNTGGDRHPGYEATPADWRSVGGNSGRRRVKARLNYGLSSGDLRVSSKEFGDR